MPYFLSKEEFEHLRNLLQLYDSTVRERNRALLRLAEKVVAECVCGHKVIVDVKEFRRVPIFRARKKLTSVTSCPYCGAPIVEIYKVPEHPKFAEYEKTYEELLRRYTEDIRAIVEKHPLWALWLKDVKGVGVLGAARMIYIFEYTKSIRRGPSPIEMLTGFAVVWACPKCGTWIKGLSPKANPLCPKCKTRMVRRVVGKWIKGGLPYRTEFKGWLSKIVEIIAQEAYRALSEFWQGKRKIEHVEDVGVYGVHYWYKFVERYDRKKHELISMGVKEDEAIRRALVDAFNAARVSTGKLLIQHGWMIMYVLRFPEDAKVRPIETRLHVLRHNPERRLIPPLLDLPAPEVFNHPLYEILKQYIKPDLIPAAYADYEAKLEKVLDALPRIFAEVRKRKQAKEELEQRLQTE